MVSRQQLDDVEDLQAQVFHVTLIAGLAAAVLGALVILWRTGRVDRFQEIASVAPEASSEPPQPPAEGPPVEDRTRELDDRNRWMRLVLDRAAQGFITVDLEGRMASERSAIVDRWFGEPAVGAMLAGYLSQHGNELASQFVRGFDRIREGVVPLERCLDQMPRRLTTTGAAAHVFDIAYAPLMRGDKLEGILLIVSDVTEQAARERAQQEQQEQRELVALAQLITGNRAEFDEFFAEVAGLVASLDAPSDPELERRTLRTLKESCAYYGLESYVAVCVAIEVSLVDPADRMTDEQRVALADGWGKVASQMMRRLA
jgi:hypothetical protein